MDLLRVSEEHPWITPVVNVDVEGVFALVVEAVEDDVVPFDLGKRVHRYGVDTSWVVRGVLEVTAAFRFHDEAYLVLDGDEEESVKHSLDEAAGDFSDRQVD